MTTDLAGLEKRLKLIEDKQAITELKYRYFQALDRRQPEEARDVFDAESAIIDFGDWGRFKHRDEFIAQFLRDEAKPEVIDNHHGANVRITITGENTATGIIDLYNTQIRKDFKTFQIDGAYYHDEYIRHSGRWWVKKLVFKIISSVVIEAKGDGTLKFKKLSVDG